MELRARAERLAEPQPPTAMPPVTKDTATIAQLENATAMHRYLRGVMCFLVFLAYMLSIFQVQNYAGNTVLHTIILVLSLCGEVCIYFIYRIKARFCGFTNPSSREGGVRSPSAHASVFHSPHLSQMCFEMVLWVVQAPPGLPAGPVANILDSFIVVRAYVFVAYLSHLSSQQVFKRAIATICGMRFDSGFAMRYNFVYRSFHPFIVVGFLAMWMCLALMYSKAENQGFGESVYFCFTTATFVGYGDFSPRSFAGRTAAFFSFLLGVVLLAWFVAIVHNVTKLSQPERNMHGLFRTNKLCAVVPGEAARVVQRAWKLYVAKKEQRSAVSIEFNAFWLTAQAASFRALRREFAAAELAFLRSTYTFEDSLTALTPASSRATSPATTPRGTPGLSDGGFASRSPRAQRRPFALFRSVKSKESQRGGVQAGARSTGTPQPPGEGAGGGGSPRLPATTATPAMTPTSPAPSGAAADVDERMRRVQEQLDELIARARRLSRAAPEPHSLTELVS